MTSARTVLDYFNEARASTNQGANESKLREASIDFLLKDMAQKSPANYSDMMAKASSGDVIALAAMGVYQYHQTSDKEKAIAMFDRAIEESSDQKKFGKDLKGSLACAIADSINNPYEKARYYHIAILEGNKSAIGKLRICFNSVNRGLGRIYTLFALNLSSFSRDQELTKVPESINNEFKRDNWFHSFRTFSTENPLYFKEFFIQHPVETLQKGMKEISDGKETQAYFKQYQNELVESILKDALTLHQGQGCFLDDIETVLPRYKKKYHYSYFDGIENLVKSKIQDVERVAELNLNLIALEVDSQIKKSLQDIVKLVFQVPDNYHSTTVDNMCFKSSSKDGVTLYEQVIQNAMKFLSFSREKRDESIHYDLQGLFFNAITNSLSLVEYEKQDINKIDVSELKKIFLQLDALKKIRDALLINQPESLEFDKQSDMPAPSAPFLSSSLPGAVSDALPESVIGPDDVRSATPLEEKANIKKPSPESELKPAAPSEKKEDITISISNTKKYARVLCAIYHAEIGLQKICKQNDKPSEWSLFPMLSSILLGTMMPVAITLAATPGCLIPGFLFIMAIMAGIPLCYFIPNYRDPLAVNIRDEKKGASGALKFFDKTVRGNANVETAHKLSSVSAFRESMITCNRRS